MHSAMRRLQIRDDDGDLFDVPLEPIVYHCYKENSKEIRRMVKQQGAGFWIQFVTSFRSFISNSGLDRPDGCECCEEVFIDMLKILTTVDSFTEFVSLTESLKMLHVLLFSRYGCLLTGANIVTAQIMSGFHKPLHTFPTYSRFVGAVVVLYQRWTRAPKIRARTPPAEWIPPAHWSQQNGCGPRAYECYLYDNWGNALYRMIGVDKEVMKFFNPQKGGDSISPSSSKTHNNVGNMCATQRRKARNRRRRNRNKNKNGGITQPSGTLNEVGSNVERTIAGDSNNAQSGTVGQKRKKKETGAALPTSSETESTDTFQYDSLFKFSNRKMNVDSGGNNVKEAGEQESRVSSCAAGETSGTANRTRKDATLKYEKLFGFKEKSHVSGYTDSKSAANDKQKDLTNEMDANLAVHNSKKKGAVYHPTDKQFTTNRDTAKETKERDFFRYDRLFNFGTRKQNAPADTNKTKEKDFFRYDKLFNFSTHRQNAPENADNKATTNKTEEKNFFRYDKLFNFGTQRQNAPENADDKAATSKTEERDFFRYDKLFNFSTQRQNAPENADNKSTTNKAEEKDFFRYDRLFSFSTRKQNAPDGTDDASISSDDSYQFDLEDESQTLDDDYDDDTAFYMFGGGSFGGPFQREPHKKKMSQPVRKYLMQKCSNCNILEKYPGMYKACRRCLEEGVRVPKVYCGEHCGHTHWRKQHRTDHRTFGNKYTTFRV